MLLRVSIAGLLLLSGISGSTLAIPIFMSSIASADDVPLHSWESVQYQDLPCPWAGGHTTPALLSSKDGLILALSFTQPGFRIEGAEEFVEPEADKISVRMHFTDGHVVEHSEPGPFDNIFGWVGTSTRRVGVFRRVFPWGDNKLEEAWMELRFPGHVFWLAVPYGFTRNPLQKLCASSDGGIPEFAPAMEPLGENAKIVNWKRVEYDLGAIQNDWSLRLLQSNPTDGCSELALYRGDSDVEKKMPLWDVHSPRTIVWIESSGSVVQKCRAVSSQLQGDRIRRDLFKINHNPTNGELRDWGKIVIKVDDKSYAAILPSSLFRCFHGHTTWDPRSVLRSSTAQ